MRENVVVQTLKQSLREHNAWVKGKLSMDVGILRLKNELLSFKYRGHELKVPRDNFFIPYATFISGEYDFLNIGPKDIVIDAGANVGDFTLKAARKALLVVAIEPNSDSLELLKSNTRDFSNVIVIDRALSDRMKNIHLTGHGVTSMVSPENGSIVAADTLDNIIRSLNLAPTILKMDIEGEEKLAIPNQSCLGSLRRVVIETHSKEDWIVCSSTLEGLGFKCNELKKSEVIRRTIGNIMSMPISFFAYEISTKFYAVRAIFTMLLKGKTSIPALDSGDIRLLEASKESDT